jgi:hypothetical protein
MFDWTQRNGHQVGGAAFRCSVAAVADPVLIPVRKGAIGKKLMAFFIDF